MFKVIGKKYAVRRAIPETHENQGSVFSFHILPESLLDLPGSGDLSFEIHAFKVGGSPQSHGTQRVKGFAAL